MSRYAANAPLLTPPWDIVSIVVSNNFIKLTAPLLLPLSLTALPLSLNAPK